MLLRLAQGVNIIDCTASVQIKTVFFGKFKASPTFHPTEPGDVKAFAALETALRRLRVSPGVE